MNYLKKELYNLIKEDSSIFEFLQEGSLDGMWYWDLENPEQEWMNPRFWQILGYNPDEKKHLASEWQNLIFQDDLQVALENFKRHCADPKHPYDQVVRYWHKDGSIVWIRCRGIAIRDDTGKPIRMLGAHTDLTALKKVERKLKESEELLNTAFDAIQDGISVLDKDLTIVRVNKIMRDWYSHMLPFEGLKKCYQVFHGKDGPCEFCPTLKAFKTGLPVKEEVPFVRGNGERGILELYAFPIISTAGKPTRVVEYAKDITERKKLEKEKEENIIKLQKSLNEIKTLRGIIPICSNCKKIRDDKGFWNQVESYMREHTEAEFTHGICPACAEKLYPEAYKKIKENNNL
jgi:PAS domain S-box-containing protein